MPALKSGKKERSIEFDIDGGEEVLWKKIRVYWIKDKSE